MTAPTVEDTDLSRDSGHELFCWCHNHADAIGVFRWLPSMPVLRFPLDNTSGGTQTEVAA